MRLIYNEKYHYETNEKYPEIDENMSDCQRGNARVVEITFS